MIETFVDLEFRRHLSLERGIQQKGWTMTESQNPITQACDTVTVILSDGMIEVIDIFRDLNTNFEVNREFLLNEEDGSTLNHLFSNILSRAEDEIIRDAIRIYKTCIRNELKPFKFKPLKSPLATSDEIAVLVLISASQQGRYGFAGEAAIRLGCSQSLTALRAAYELGSWLAAVGIKIGAIDPRLMREPSPQLADTMIDGYMEKLAFNSPSSRFSSDYLRLVQN